MDLGSIHCLLPRVLVYGLGDHGLLKICYRLKGGPSDLGTKNLQKYYKNHPYTPTAF